MASSLALSSHDSGENYDDVIEIVPSEEYDSHRAKLRSSLSWLLSKVYGSHVPKELLEPFYETAEGQLCLKPALVNQMSSSQLYCQACANIFPDNHTQWQGHWSIIQMLSRKGIYISEVQESAVTETVLVQTAPFRLKAHLALIDALMKAYTCEVASIEKVVRAVRCFTTFPASTELPGTPEEALVFWVNKVATLLRTAGVSQGKQEEIIEGSQGQKVRVVSRSSLQQDTVQVPLLEDLMRDVGDGCSLAAVIAFYRPDLMNIKDLCLKENIGIADSLYNLRQIGQFCRDHLPCRRFHFSYEDLLYAHDDMKVNIVTLLADLFYYFQGCQPKDTTSARSSTERVDSPAGKQSSQSIFPVSQATKRSFHKHGSEEVLTALSGGRSATSSPVSQQHLLQKRNAGRHCIPQEEPLAGSRTSSNRRNNDRRSMSLSTPQDRELIRTSLQAWQDDQRLLDRLQEHSGADGTDQDNQDSCDQNSNANNSLKLDLTGLESFNHRNFREVESVSNHSNQPDAGQLNSALFSSRSPTVDRLEPLLPAVLKPTKEKDANWSKAEERGDRVLRKKRTTSTESQPRRQPLEISNGVSSPQTSMFQSDKSQSHTGTSLSEAAKACAYAAFVIEQDARPDSPREASSKAKITKGVLKSAGSGDLNTASSYTLTDRADSIQAARAAGIPVVADGSENSPGVRTSREGSIASSGEYSDHESQKIHQEYKVRESSPVLTETEVTAISPSNNLKPFVLITDHLNKITNKDTDDYSMLNKLPSPTTNFAELKRLKDKLGYNLDRMDKKALIYMQNSSQGGPYDKTSTFDLKSAFSNKDQRQTQNKVPESISSLSLYSDSSGSPVESPDNQALETAGHPGSLEMQQLRLKLEQKRKDIERKKHRQEAQQNKMRQQLGKAAFMRVVSKHVDGAEEGESTTDEVDTTRSEPSSTQAQIQARLGHPAQKAVFGGPSLGTQSPRPQSARPQSTQASPKVSVKSSPVSAEASAHRFTDWRTQSQLSRVGGGDEQSPLLSGPGAARGTNPNSHLGSVLSNKALSLQRCLPSGDTAKNSGFMNSSDPVQDGDMNSGRAEPVDRLQQESFMLHNNEDLLAGARLKSTPDSSQAQSRSQSQSPLLRGSQVAASQLPQSPVVVTNIRQSPLLVGSGDTASTVRRLSDLEYQEYDSSLDKLNSSLTELQGEIMRLSLQHEQLKAAQSPVSGFSSRLSDNLPVTGAQSRPIHGIPPQAPYQQAAMLKQQLPAASTSSPHPDGLAGRSTPYHTELSHSHGSDLSNHNASLHQLRTNSGSFEDIMNVSNDGFFVSFGDTPTPKRVKPKLPDHRSRGVSPLPVPSVGVDSSGAEGSGHVATPPSSTHLANTELVNSSRDTEDAVSPHVGFVIKDEAVEEMVTEDERQKKKIKLIEMQKKRKDDQEKKRLDKEAEIARKLEQKQQKEEEQERKKAEEKVRREVIFQQHLQKKQEEEDNTSKPQPPKRRDASASKQRPKSMFIKSKAPTPEPGALAPDSGSSSQEDLTTSRTNLSGRSTPSVMSALRSKFHFGLPPPSQIRKAVSCNVLQGSANGNQAPATYRRPPSPDVRLKHQRQRGSSQESGSETGSGSNPGSDYAGPKLYVKPSAKSNRHIIVNAISHCCLAGSVNTDLKNKVLEEMSKCEANHFLILFRDAGCQYRGLFLLYPETEEAFKVHGVGPKHIMNAMCEKFYKYNSGAKSFSEITSTKHLSVSVDAVVLHTAVWKTVKGVVKR